MTTPLHCLIVEDSENDAQLLLRQLHTGGYEVTWQRVETPEAMQAALTHPSWEIVISGYELARFSGPAALEILQASGLDLPFIIVSGKIAEDDAVAMMRTGAHDYLMKDRLAHLVPAVRRELREAVNRRERRRAEAELRVSEERYRTLFENNPLPMWVHDVESLQFLAINESAVRHYGYTRGEFLGMTIRQICHPEDLAGLLLRIEHDQTVGESAGEVRHRRKDGTIIQTETFSKPLTFEGRAARLVLANDVTEKRLFEKKFLHAQRLESIGMLAAGIAHDLNNVLAPIVFAAPMLREHLSTPRDAKMIDTIEQSAGRGAALVKQILGFVHTTSSEFQPTQVKHLARDIASVIEETFPKSIELEQHIPSNLWPVQGNATQLHQVLMNLCVNARDAMPQGGKLRLVAANRQLDAAEAATIPGAHPGAWLVLEIGDTGTGIAPEVLEQIWTPFFTTKPAGKGTGLGLSTVRSIVLGHHGFIQLQTAAGHGTTFRVFLPAIESEVIRATSTTPAEISGGHQELILIVDDDAAIRGIVTTILEEHGYRVVACADGVEAFAQFQAQREAIALVVTDVDMPRLGGLGLVQAILRIRPETRILAMSGLSARSTGGADLPTIQTVAHAFLRKPFKTEDLLGAVHQLLQRAEKN